MINYNRLGYEIKRDLANFSEKISTIPISSMIPSRHYSQSTLCSWKTFFQFIKSRKINTSQNSSFLLHYNSILINFENKFVATVLYLTAFFHICIFPDFPKFSILIDISTLSWNKIIISNHAAAIRKIIFSQFKIIFSFVRFLLIHSSIVYNNLSESLSP